MPLSEFYAMARGKGESAQQKTTAYSTDPSHILDNEFVELVWENGQIMMQGQSSRVRRIPFSNNFQSQTTKLRDKDLGNMTNSKTGKFGVMDFVSNDFIEAVPSGEMGLAQDDDNLPWWNYPIEDPLQHDYCSDLLPELSGVTVNDLTAQSSFSSIDKRNSCNQTISGTNSVSVHNGLCSEQAIASSEVGESLRSKSGQFYPWSFQESQTSIPSLRSAVSGVISDNTSNTKGDVCGDSVIKFQKKDSEMPNTSSSFMNFSLFSRPAAVVRANLQNVSSMGGENKGAAPHGCNLDEPTLIDKSSGLRNVMGSHSQHNPVPPKVDSKRFEESHTAEQSVAVCREDVVKNDKLPNQVIGVKTIEPVVASSSVCSGNSMERASNDPMLNLKRKYRETDDYEGRSEDVEEESVGVRKAAATRGGAGSKRSRAAEVHNLSERRRRDRINEKMRALQELIPNCNKVDKASMLDEAIEYLKILQLQVQIMSMGAGMYMPPMMLPPGMPHMHPAHMAHFSPMAVGMGMGMGFGMGMNGAHFSPHFSAPRPPSMLGPTNLQGMTGPNLQVYGHPGQGLAMSAPQAQSVPLSGGPPINLAMGLNANGMAAPVEVLNSTPSKSKDLIQTSNSQTMQSPDASSSMNQKCGQATNEGFAQSTSAMKNDQASDGGRGKDLNLTKENDIVPSRPGCCD